MATLDRDHATTGVLVVDDDPAVLATLESALTAAQYQVYLAQTGWDGLRQLYQHQPDVVLLDVLMPDLDGWETCAQIRALSDVPVIMITGMTTEDDLVRGLDLGADDYVAKPFRPREVLARVRAVLRRQRRLRVDNTRQGKLAFDEGRLVIDLDRQEVQIQGRGLGLTATEFRLLTYLVANRGRVLSQRQILEHVWGPEYADQADYVKVYIRSLRGKIEACARQPRYIVSRRGLGYSFVPEPVDAAQQPSA